MASSDIIKIGFDYRASLEQFEKETNSVFDGISNKAGKQKITIRLDAKDDKIIDKIKELQKLKLDKFTFEFGNSGLEEQLQTFDKLENKINDIINLSKNNLSSTFKEIKKAASLDGLNYGTDEYNNELKKVTSSIVDMGKKGQESTREYFIEVQKLLNLYEMFRKRADGNLFSKNTSQVDKFSAFIKNSQLANDLDPVKDTTSDIFNGCLAIIDNFVDDSTKKFVSLKDAIEKVITISEGLKTISDTKTSMNSDVSTNSQIEELKSDITEVKTELNDVKEKISGINTEGFENIRNDVEKTKESVKELNDELTEMKSNLSSTPQIESNISSELKDIFNVDDSSIKDVTKANENLATTSKNVHKAVKSSTSAIKENISAIDDGMPSIDELVKRANEAAYTLTKGKDIVSQTGKRQVHKVERKNDDGTTYTGMEGSFSYVEKTQEGQLRSVQAIFNEVKQQWQEETTSLVTYFNQVEKAIISADNKINSLENDRDKTLASHPGYDISADEALIASERNHRAELQKTLDTYATEKEYVYQIEAANKRIAENQQRLANVSAKKENLRNAISDEQFNKDWDAAIAENNKRNAESAKQLAKEFDSAWNEASKINSALDETKNTISSLSQMKELSSQFGEMNTKVDSLNSELVSGKITVSDYKKEVKSLTSEYSKLVNIQQNRDASEYKSQQSIINSYGKRTDSYDSKLATYQATASKFADGGWTSDKYTQNIDKLNTAIKNYKNTLAEVQDKGIASDKDIENLNKYESEIKQVISTVSNMSATEKGYSLLSGQKAMDKINSILKENSAMSREAKAQIRAWYNEIASGNPTKNLTQILGEVQKIVNAEAAAGRAGKSMFDAIKEKAWYGFAGAIGTYFGFNDILRYGGEAIDTIVQLDDALVDLKKTTSMSGSELENFYYDANDVAKQLGVTTQEVIDQASAWSRLGFSTKEASTEMAKLSSQFASISPGMDVATAQEGLVSIMKAWDIDYSDVKSQIMDPINQLGNTMALDNQDIVDGMERSAAALAAVGTSTEDALAMFSGIQEVLQNAEKSGTSLRSVALRLRSFDETTEEYSSDLANITGELADLTKTAEHSQGVSVFKDGSTTEFKDLTDYFREIANIWDEMSQKQQNDYLLKAFGRTQAQGGAALIQNFKDVDKALQEIEESSGSADKEMSTIESSLSYKINALKETWVGCVQDMVSRGDLGTIVTGLTKISEIITSITGKLGLFGTITTTASGILGAKGLGLT